MVKGQGEGPSIPSISPVLKNGEKRKEIESGPPEGFLSAAVE